jgi:hypothetical protein
VHAESSSQQFKRTTTLLGIPAECWLTMSNGLSADPAAKYSCSWRSRAVTDTSGYASTCVHKGKNFGNHKYIHTCRLHACHRQGGYQAAAAAVGLQDKLQYHTEAMPAAFQGAYRCCDGCCAPCLLLQLREVEGGAVTYLQASSSIIAHRELHRLNC